MVLGLTLSARQIPRMAVLSLRCRSMAASFSGVMALDFGLRAKVLLQSLHLALWVPASVLPYLTTGWVCWQCGQATVKVIMPKGIRFSRPNQQAKLHDQEVGGDVSRFSRPIRIGGLYSVYRGDGNRSKRLRS